jgi:ElaB/YqjD/DUF883 family membrane-anchored ribosome-binding protein
MQSNGTNPSFDDRIDAFATSLKHAVERLSTRASEIKERAVEVKDHASTNASSFAAKATKIIKDHPFIAIGVAAGTGYLVVRLVRR